MLRSRGPAAPQPPLTDEGVVLSKVFLLSISFGLCSVAWAAPEPGARPLRIVTTAIGGGNDFVARLLARSLAERLARPVIVDNRPSSVVPGEIVARASPDGNTLLVASNTLWLGPLLEKTPYDAFADFSPISLLGVVPTLLVVHGSLPARSVAELIALARARPSELNYASNATGGSAHLAAELFKRMAGVELVRVSYKGNAAALTDLMAGHVHVMFPVAAAVVPLMSSGKLRALAIGSARPSALFPELPTIATAGVPGYETATYMGMFAPARTPPPVVDRLHRHVAETLADTQIGERYLKAGIEPAVSSPAALRGTMKNEVSRMAAVIRTYVPSTSAP
jgi:tripartite-type tricarboxylate transporter receptor subunit TctC